MGQSPTHGPSGTEAVPPPCMDGWHGDGIGMEEKKKGRASMATEEEGWIETWPEERVRGEERIGKECNDTPHRPMGTAETKEPGR